MSTAQDLRKLFAPADVIGPLDPGLLSGPGDGDVMRALESFERALAEMLSVDLEFMEFDFDEASGELVPRLRDKYAGPLLETVKMTLAAITGPRAQLLRTSAPKTMPAERAKSLIAMLDKSVQRARDLVALAATWAGTDDELQVQDEIWRMPSVDDVEPGPSIPIPTK